MKSLPGTLFFSLIAAGFLVIAVSGPAVFAHVEPSPDLPEGQTLNALLWRAHAQMQADSSLFAIVRTETEPSSMGTITKIGEDYFCVYITDAANENCFPLAAVKQVSFTRRIE